MEKILFGKEKGFFKANLHCHSVVSDGTKTPEELKEMYVKQGYSVIAFTDHDVLVPHNELTDGHFLALNGYEVEINDNTHTGQFSTCKTCHMCFIALDEDNFTQVCYHRSAYLFGNAPKYRDIVKYDESKPDFVRNYTPECINQMISEARNGGFFVTYNHPVWSLETLDDYGKYKGLNAMEICNYSCCEQGIQDYNENQYDEMLRMGQRMYCVSADDNHNYRNDSFGGFTVINAPKLEYKAVTDALLNGNIYASQGPEIKMICYEDGKISVECSECESVRINTGIRRSEIFYGTRQEPLKRAEFEVKPDDVYVRLTVTDFSGKHANSRAYFIDELEK